MLVHAVRRRRFAGGLRAGGALAVAAAFLTLVALPAAATGPVTIGADEVTDQSGVLQGDDRTTIQAALDRLNADTGLQLYVVYVTDFDGQQPADWAQATAAASGLGADDVVLAVATQVRRYALAPEQNGNVSSAEMQQVYEQVGQKLRGDDWAGAAVTAADGLREAAASPAGSGGSGTVDQPGVVYPPMEASTGPGVGSVLLVGIVVVGGLVVLGVALTNRNRNRDRTRPGPPDELSGLPTAELDRRSGSALVAIDDALRSSDQELGFAQAQFGADATKDFAQVLADGKARTTEAFRLRQALDDDVPDTEQQRRAWATQILALCAQVSAALDAQKQAFDELRNLEDHVEEALDAHAQSSASLVQRIGPARATLKALTTQYSAEALASVVHNVDQADQLLSDANEAIGSGKVVARAPDHRGEAVGYARAAEAALDHAKTLLDAVDSAGADLAAAGQRIDAGIASITADLSDAARLAPGGAAAPQLQAAQQAVQVAAAARGGSGDPLAALRGLTAAEAALDAALAPLREREEQDRRALALLDETLGRLDSSIRATTDFVNTRRGVVGPEARTRLAEAQRLRDQAVAQRATDPAGALPVAQRAQQLVDDANRAAQQDEQDNQPPWGGTRTGGGGNNNLGGMVLGGLILGSLLRGGGGGGGGWGGGGGFGGGGGGFGGGGGGGGGGFGGGGFGGGF